MRRRDVVKGLAAGLAFAAAPSPAWAGDRGLRRALRIAIAEGKPVLVLVAPPAEPDRTRRGGAFGDLLHLADDATLRVLALTRVVCVAEDDVSPLCEHWVPHAQLVVVETSIPDHLTASAHGTRLPWPDAPVTSGLDPLARQRGARLGAVVRQAVLPRSSSLADRADQVRARIDANEATAVLADLRRGTAADDDVRRVAALLAAHAQLSPDLAPLVHPALASSVRRALVDRDPDGAHWVHPSPGDPGPSGEAPWLGFDA